MRSKFIIVIASVLSALIAGAVAFGVSRWIAKTTTAGSTRMHQLDIVDERGRIGVTLSTSDQGPKVELLDASGQKRMTMTLDKNGYGSVRLSNPNASGSVASLEIDDKGAHVKFDRPGGASSYLFLNNAGGSGVVLLDPKGSRKLDLMVAPSGETEFRRYDQPGPKTP